MSPVLNVLCVNFFWHLVLSEFSLPKHGFWLPTFYFFVVQSIYKFLRCLAQIQTNKQADGRMGGWVKHNVVSHSFNIFILLFWQVLVHLA